MPRVGILHKNTTKHLSQLGVVCDYVERLELNIDNQLYKLQLSNSYLKESIVSFIAKDRIVSESLADVVTDYAELLFDLHFFKKNSTAYGGNYS